MNVMIEVEQGVVTLDDRNVAIDVELRGVFAQWQPTAMLVWSQLYEMAERAYMDQDEELQTVALDACHALAPTWLRSHIALHAIDVWRAGEWTERQLVEAWNR